MTKEMELNGFSVLWEVPQKNGGTLTTVVRENITQEEAFELLSMCSEFFLEVWVNGQWIELEETEDKDYYVKLISGVI